MGKTNQEEIPLTRKQVAEYFGVHPMTVRRWEVEGKLPKAFDILGKPRYSRAAVNALKKNQSPTNETP